MRQLLFIIFLCLSSLGHADTRQPVRWNSPGAGNPLIPGYFADPTIRKFGDTFYIYATTDGTGNGYGPAQVWTSKDFRNWTNHIMDWPTTEVVWAPDVMQDANGLYRYFYCEPCVIHEGIGTTPLGPWKNVLGSDDAVLIEDRYVHNAITLDGQTFVDDDGSTYIYFGTWGIYDGFGCGVAKFNPDMKSFSEKKLIPNTEIKDFFEAPFVIKRNGIYYFTYSSGSCHDHTYRVQYATSTVGPMGPYQYQGCILETNDDKTVHGPGHHSILQDGEDFYIVYHRHNIPQATHGFNRQICIDELHFTDDGKIAKVVPTHDGVLPRSVRDMPVRENIAFGAKTTASSYYSDDFRPDYATDDNNATLWKPATCHGNDYLEIDLGSIREFKEVQIQFEFATFYYQYKIETSTDGQQWTLYADHTNNTQPGSPMTDAGSTKARYIRVWVTGREMNGHFGGIWNVKVYNDVTPETERVQQSAENKSNAWKLRHASLAGGTSGCTGSDTPLLHINAKDYPVGTFVTEITSSSSSESTPSYTFSGGSVRVELRQDRPAFHFTGQQVFRSNKGLPDYMNYSAPYSIEAWILNPEVERNECVAQFIPDRHDLSTIELCNGSDPQNGLVMHNASFENSGAPQLIKQQEGQWQHWVITYDGYMERHYLNGKKVSEKNMMLLLRPGRYIQLGASFDGNHPFNGFLHSLSVYDRTLTAEEIKTNYERPLDYDIEAAKALQRSAARKELTDTKVEVIAVTPQLLKIRLKDSEGNVMKPGFNDIAFEVKGVGETEWKSEPTALFSVPKPGRYTITAKGRTPEKEIVSLSSQRVKTSAKNFYTFTDDFAGNTLGTSWKTLKGSRVSDAEATTGNGCLTLSSASGNFNANADDNAILLYQEVKGDFIVQCKVDGMTGSDDRRTPSYNEGGLIVLDDRQPGNQQIVQCGVFPNYNCGNMLTTVSHHGHRPQYPRGNGWNYDPWLQIEREGNLFHVRTSKDGNNWTETTGSPVEMPDFTADRPVKVGMFQVTYTDNKAAVSFKDFKLYQRKMK